MTTLATRWPPPARTRKPRLAYPLWRNIATGFVLAEAVRQGWHIGYIQTCRTGTRYIRLCHFMAGNVCVRLSDHRTSHGNPRLFSVRQRGSCRLELLPQWLAFWTRYGPLEPWRRCRRACSDRLLAALVLQGLAGRGRPRLTPMHNGAFTGRPSFVLPIDKASRPRRVAAGPVRCATA